MFSSFFYLLRKRGLSVSFNEWMTLLEALKKGLHHSSFTGFYYLCRAILVKSETDFDRFDGAFLEYFKDMEFTEELPKELLEWLENPKDKPKDKFDMDRARENAFIRRNTKNAFRTFAGTKGRAQRRQLLGWYRWRICIWQQRI